jgi:hypothetical protein
LLREQRQLEAKVIDAELRRKVLRAAALEAEVVDDETSRTSGGEASPDEGE